MVPIIFRNFTHVKTKNMRAEEQLKLAYMTIAELKDQNAKLVDAIAALERRLAESDGRDRRMVEEFYKGMIEDMRTAQEKEIASLRASQEKELENLRSVIIDLTSKISSLAANGKVNAGKLYGRKSEKSGRLSKRRDDDDRSSDKDNFDGTPGSDKGPASDVKGTDSGDASSPKRGTEDTVKSLQKKLLRSHPGSEMKIERIDYSKAAAYTDSPTYHKLEEYYKLPEGAYFVTRNGETDKNYVKVILFHPATVEEHIYETATVRFRDEDDIRTIDTISIDRPVVGCCFGTETLSYILMEKFWYNTPFDQIVRKLRALGLRMSKSTLGDNVHRAIEYMRVKMKEWWEKAMLTAGYWMIDETPGLVGCEDKNGNRAYKKKYFWSITAKTLKLSWLFYEKGSRGAKAIRPYLEKFIGFYTTDGYVCYKVFDKTDEELAESETQPPEGIKKRSACLVHIRRQFVNALEENYEEAMWFIERMGMIFAKEHIFKGQKLKSYERYIARLKPGSVADLMKSIEDRLADYALSDDAGCGELLKKALRYARAEWPAMKRVLESGEVEISNNISEQSVRKLKMNLRNAGNIGSENSAADNAFMYSVIESCRHNGIDPGKYVSYLLGKLKTSRDGEDLTGLLPCYCGL